VRGVVIFRGGPETPGPVPTTVIMKRMKLLLLLLASLACAADLASVRKVYVMPMARGLDQYLANRLASEHVFEIVTDPKLADAVFTDRLGEAFQTQLEDISPSPKEPEPVAKAPEPPAKSADAGASQNLMGFGGDTANKLANPASNSSFGRGRGTLFLVDAKSRSVVWSVFDPPKNTSSKELDRTASNVVGRIKKELNPKK
jgi:hypothetical protein